MEQERKLKPMAPKGSVTQPWVLECSMMQQTVLLGIVRGPDSTAKYHPVKAVLRWYRRCLLYSALDGDVIRDPWDLRGGSFTGPSCNPPAQWVQDDPESTLLKWQQEMDMKFTDFMKTMDEMPIHFWLHMMHAIEIMGYKHSDPFIAGWWRKCYVRMVLAMHVLPEPEDALDERLGDNQVAHMRSTDEAFKE